MAKNHFERSGFFVFNSNFEIELLFLDTRA